MTTMRGTATGPSDWRRILAPVAASVALGGCAGVLDPAGPIGAAQKQLLLNALVIMSVIVVPVILGTLGFAFWFRGSNARAVRRPDFVYSGRIEAITWGIPILVVLFLSGLAWVGSHDLDPARPIASSRPPLQVEVVSLDWKWLFIYPGLGIASINHLVIPAGTPVRFRLTSASVMTTFFIPQLGSMIYTMNGMATQLHLQADRPGEYRGMAAHFTGAGFADMTFTVASVTPEDFSAWADRTRDRGPALDREGYVALLRQSHEVRPFTYGTVQPHLFDEVVRQALPTGDGPDPGRSRASRPDHAGH